ncbi:MAG: GerMN domain-containing protein [Spirochaetaceae bacterium]|jgi:hypothetical protein|nr:GerMN domain-containing protein [Spirochaetaceae bacterium]
MERKKKPYKPIYKQPRSKEEKLKIFAAVMFWAVFGVFITCLFILNWPKIRTTMQNALWPAWFKSRTPPPEVPPAPPPDETFLSPEPEAMPSGVPPAPGIPAESIPAPRGSAESRPAPSPEGLSEGVPVSGGTAPMRERTLYFIQVDKSGAIIRTKTGRAIPASDSPLLDVMQSLLKGPGEGEKRQGLISLIPEETQIVSAQVSRDTAYINLSESFQYNPYGVEGYAGALEQIIWTATEFVNVKDVQILVEGRRLDYLGEGIWIGSPIARDSF